MDTETTDQKKARLKAARESQVAQNAATSTRINSKTGVAVTAKKTTLKAKADVAPKVVAKPAVVKGYAFGTTYDGPSGPLNARTSRTAVDFAKFGSRPNDAMTDRDNKALADLRRQFAAKQFERQNIDAGILRRLGERGFIAHVGGTPVAPDAKFKLTQKALAASA